MTDIVNRETRSRMMSGIRGKNTKPERLLRSALHASGLRYRLNLKGLPGSPDLVFPRYKAVIFVHGCFWHRHEGCPKASVPQSNRDFWNEKFQSNVQRDQRQIEQLLHRGWRVAVVWECEIGRAVSRPLVLAIVDFLKSDRDEFQFANVAALGLAGRKC